MEHYVVGQLKGGCGNQFYQIATSYAYSRKHDLKHYVTLNAENSYNNKSYFKNIPTFDFAKNHIFEYIDSDGCTYYQDLPKINDVMLHGYWQCFKYFVEYRKDLLVLFDLPYNRKEGYASIHIRRGDFLTNKDNVSILPLDYYRSCIYYIVEKGIKKFLIFSDDMDWCKSIFNDYFYEGIKFEFSEGKDALEDLSLMSSCEHNILSNSTFSYAASWFNNNNDKIILTPDETKMFKGYNKNMIPIEFIKM